MKYFQFKSKSANFSKFIVIVFTLMALLPTASLRAASGNLIKNPSFEQGSVTTYWDLWNIKPEERTYTMYRSYDVPYGTGSYSAAIETTGPTGKIYDAGIATKPSNNPFTVTSDKTYFFSLYIKASQPTTISVYLQKADDYQPLGPAQQIAVSTNWEKKVISLTPTSTANASLGMAFGNLPEGSTLYFDALDLSEKNLNVSTNDIGGFVGESKTIALSGNNNWTINDIEIELPYFSSETNTIERKKFKPKSVSSSSASFIIPGQTFSGLGKVLYLGAPIGEFNYNVFAKVTEVSPAPIRADEDLVVYGTGFNPDLSKNFIILKGIAANGTTFDIWIAPHTIDSSLTQLVVKLPIGLANSKLQVRTYYTNISGTSVENKSNMLAYSIMPVIYGVTWTERGREQVGDKLTITGKGIAYKPVVHFYNEKDQLISKKVAVVKKINIGKTNTEEIEVVTPITLNKVKITVKVDSYESDKADALVYTAKPTITSIKSTHKRTLGDNSYIWAAKTGETIRFIGQGFKTSQPVIIGFWSIHGNVTEVSVDPSNIDPNGKWIDVIVPAGIQNGQVNLKINGQKSNNVTFEVIPTIITTQPIEPIPGTILTITAQGIALDPNQVTIYFKSINNQEIAVKPLSLKEVNNNVEVTVLTPRAIPDQGTSIKIQYAFWLNDETYRVVAAPHIETATINRDNDMLVIKGYGFSATTKNNKITYKYADGTVVTPKTKVIGVYATSEGQEIRVTILDDYYYGFVSVTVGENKSNEVSVGPAVITRLERRSQFVSANQKVMGVLYISGSNFGSKGDVMVGKRWATTHYRSNTFIIAVVDREDLYNNPVIVTKHQ